MALFRRKQQEDVLPEEVRDYYRSEQRNRLGIAWLLAAGGFILTIAVVALLFWGGRWAYQRIFVSDDSTGTTSITSDDTSDEASDPDEDTDRDTSDLPEFTTSSDEDESEAEPAPEDQPATETDTAGAVTELPRTGPTAE